MTDNRKAQNARQRYYQAVLSGWGDCVKPKDKNSASNASQQEDKPENRETWEQKIYHISIPLVITETSIHGDQYEYTVSINANSDIPVIPATEKGKKLSKQAFTIPGKTNRKKTRLPMVYGIHTSGNGAFSRVNELNPIPAITQLHSAVLEQIDRAIQRRVQFIAGQKTDEDATVSLQSPSPQKDLGTDKAKRRSKKIRAEIRDEALPEESTRLDGTSGTLLGKRQGNGEGELAGIRDNANQ